MWPCVLLTPTDRCRRWLRVFESRGCASAADRGWCAARTPVADGPVVWVYDEAGRKRHYMTEEDDVLGGAWPLVCDDCARPFTPVVARRQVDYDLLYAHPDGTLHTVRDVPVGAIWRVEYHESHWAGADGRCYQVQLPPGGIGDQWVIEQPSTSGGHWTRTGEAPCFTAVPSILTPRYHGYLTAGVLTDDLDGRTYGGG